MKVNIPPKEVLSVNKLLVLCVFIAFTVADIQAQNSGLRERMGAKLEATTSVVKQNSCIEYSQPEPNHVFVMTDLQRIAVE